MTRAVSPARRAREGADSHMSAKDFAGRGVPTVAARRLTALRVSASL
jgi:hypothetical protein